MKAVRLRDVHGRPHWQHGPIDLVIGADGDAGSVEAAHEAAWARFTTVLDELVVELPLLKREVDGAQSPHGAIARTMWRACLPHRPRFVTPMAAVAGAVADALIAHYRRDGVDRAWINNGGDIAFHLAAGQSLRVGLYADLGRFDAGHWNGHVRTDGDFVVHASQSPRGVATSGWRGRSFSLGIADSVTVLASTAAGADAAATMIANAVDVADPRIVRRPASSLVDDGDLGDRLVTVDVPPLAPDVVRRALAAGVAHADALRRAGIIVACSLVCQGMMVVVGDRVAWSSNATVPASVAAWHGTRLSSHPMEACA